MRSEFSLFLECRTIIHVIARRFKWQTAIVSSLFEDAKIPTVYIAISNLSCENSFATHFASAIELTLHKINLLDITIFKIFSFNKDIGSAKDQKTTGPLVPPITATFKGLKSIVLGSRYFHCKLLSTFIISLYAVSMKSNESEYFSPL